MKKAVILIFLSVIYFGGKAQTYSAGAMFNPQGKIMLNKDIQKGFSLTTPLYAVFSVEVGKISYSPMFCFNDNSYGGFVSYSFGKIYNAYFVGGKSSKTRDLYLGIGTGVKVSSSSSFFIEFGSLAATWEPQFYAGISLSVMREWKTKK